MTGLPSNKGATCLATKRITLVGSTNRTAFAPDNAFSKSVVA